MDGAEHVRMIHAARMKIGKDARSIHFVRVEEGEHVRMVHDA